MLPIIFGLSGLILTAEEAALFRAADPAGYILFGRNIADKAQLRALTDSLRALSGHQNLPILIDQEGGRVARLKPPIWPDYPSGPTFGALYALSPIAAIEAMRLNALAMAASLLEMGISINCAPLLDLHHAETHNSIAERSLGGDALSTAALGRAMLDGMAAGGVLGVIKHLPGQGRAAVDSHYDLPIVDAPPEALLADIAPFRALKHAHIGMTSHTIFTHWDAGHCATMSSAIIDGIIRTEIGFDGLLLSDDIGMQALKGTMADRALRCIEAGCDIALHCSGDLAEMTDIAACLAPIKDAAQMRLDKVHMALQQPLSPSNLDAEQIIAKRDDLLRQAA